MIPPPVLGFEESRLSALRRYRMDDVGREDAFDHATDLAARIFDVPISLVSIIGATEQRFKGSHGLQALCTSRDVSFCGHAIASAGIMVVEDTLQDERFRDNPLVTGDPGIRFYAGAPLLLQDGMPLGTLCLIGRESRRFTNEEREVLLGLAKLVADVIELRLDGILDSERQQALGRMKDDFVSTTSHELRTPLTSIAGSLGLLISGAAGQLPKRATRLIQIAHANSDRLVRLVNDILDLDKLGSGGMQLDAKSLEVAEILSEVTDTIGEYAGQAGVTLVLEPLPARLSVIADRDRLIQVLTNLISNAVKFSNRQTTVTLSACEAGPGRVRMTVTDRGRGISDEFRQRIFTRFAQADRSDAREKEGSGLGLSIVKELVTHMGGDVSYDTCWGSGTSFHIDLPSASLE